MEYTYEILRFKTAPQLGDNVDVITAVEFMLKATDERDGTTYTAGMQGSAALTEPTEDTTFIPYADVTLENVVAWIEAEMEMQYSKDILAKDIENQIVPKDVVRDDLPWVTEETEE